MNKELTEKLYNDFPSLYSRDRNFFYGFQIPDGWYDLIYNLSLNIMKVIPIQDKNIIDTDEYLEVVRYTVNTVKNKFGGLRYYLNHSTPEINDLVSHAENKSHYTCTACGKENDLPMGNGKRNGMCENCFIIKSILE